MLLSENDNNGLVVSQFHNRALVLTCCPSDHYNNFTGRIETFCTILIISCSYVQSVKRVRMQMSKCKSFLCCSSYYGFGGKVQSA